MAPLKVCDSVDSPRHPDAIRPRPFAIQCSVARVPQLFTATMLTFNKTGPQVTFPIVRVPLYPTAMLLQFRALEPMSPTCHWNDADMFIQWCVFAWHGTVAWLCTSRTWDMACASWLGGMACSLHGCGLQFFFARNGMRIALLWLSFFLCKNWRALRSCGLQLFCASREYEPSEHASQPHLFLRLTQFVVIVVGCCYCLESHGALCLFFWLVLHFCLHEI